MNSEIAPVDEQERGLSDDQIRAYARNMMRNIERDQAIAFHDTWLTKLNLDGVVAKLEAAGKITGKL